MPTNKQIPYWRAILKDALTQNTETPDRDTRYLSRMTAQDYIDKTREYLDYVEDHIENVRLSFIELVDKCQHTYWIADDARYFELHAEVIDHDVSKLSEYELVQYRDKFYPVNGFEKKPFGHYWRVNDNFDAAWEHHKLRNTHHHESLKDEIDVIHMIIDWMAMGKKFGDTPREYYEKNKHKMSISEKHVKLMYEIFDALDG